jgi:hypothetical protein
MARLAARPMPAFGCAIDGGCCIDAARALFPDAPADWIDLSTGISPQAYPANMRRNVRALPSPTALAGLEAAAAAYFGGVDAARVVAVPGSDMALRLLAGLMPAGSLGVVGPGYGGHVAMWGRSVTPVAASALEVAGQDILILANPNNPDGHHVAAARLQAVAAAVGWLIVDEAFADARPDESLMAALQAGPADSAARRIVSINPCLDAILLEVADPAQIAGISHYSQDPRAGSIPLARATAFKETSGTAEEAMAPAPDLVVSGGHVAPSTANALRRLGIPLMQMKVPETIAENMAQIRTLAAAIGHPARGEVLVAEDAAMIKGFIINKFRGDVALFADGYADIAARTGWRGLGVVPWLAAAHRLPAEDAVALHRPWAV